MRLLRYKMKRKKKTRQQTRSEELHYAYLDGKHLGYANEIEVLKQYRTDRWTDPELYNQFLRGMKDGAFLEYKKALFVMQSGVSHDIDYMEAQTSQRTGTTNNSSVSLGDTTLNWGSGERTICLGGDTSDGGSGMADPTDGSRDGQRHSGPVQIHSDNAIPNDGSDGRRQFVDRQDGVRSSLVSKALGWIGWNRKKSGT
jgi:hypothetical protein